MGHQSLTSGMELRSNILVSGNADSTVKVWDIVTGQCLQTLSGNFFFSKFKLAIRFFTLPKRRLFRVDLKMFVMLFILVL